MIQPWIIFIINNDSTMIRNTLDVSEFQNKIVRKYVSRTKWIYKTKQKYPKKILVNNIHSFLYFQ